MIVLVLAENMIRHICSSDNGRVNDLILFKKAMWLWHMADDLRFATKMGEQFVPYDPKDIHASEELLGKTPVYEPRRGWTERA